LLSSPLSDQQQEQRIDQTAQALENLRQEERRLEQEATHLVAYGDYILNQVQAARELNRWVNGNDIRRYVIDHLRLHYPGCELQQLEPGSLSFDIALSEKAKVDLAEFIRTNRLATGTRLTLATSMPIKCRFDNRVIGSPRRGEEAISQFHPLVRMISSRIMERDEQLTPAVALALTASEIDNLVVPGTYVFAVALWSFTGLQDIEKLAYAASPLRDGGAFLDPDVAERIVMDACEKGKDWLEAQSDVDLNSVYQIANDSLFARLDDEFEEYRQEVIAKNDDRADIQLHTLEQHLEQQNYMLQEVLQKHRLHGRESLARATEGRIQALQSRVEQRRMKIESRRAIRSQSKEIALAVIRVT